MCRLLVRPVESDRRLRAQSVHTETGHSLGVVAETHGVSRSAGVGKLTCHERVFGILSLLYPKKPAKASKGLQSLVEHAFLTSRHSLHGLRGMRGNVFGGRISHLSSRCFRVCAAYSRPVLNPRMDRGRTDRSPARKHSRCAIANVAPPSVEGLRRRLFYYAVPNLFFGL